MPEGPEIRRVADRLAEVLVDRTVERVRFGLPRLKPEEALLSGQRVLEVEPRGKALLTTPWATALDSSSSGLLELAQQAKRLGLLKLSHGAGVVSIDPSGLDPLHGGQQS